MASQPHYLSRRENWEAAAIAAGGALETATAAALRDYFERVAPGQFRVVTHPKDLEQLYLEEDYKAYPADYAKSDKPEKGDICWNEDAKEFQKYTGSKWVRAQCGCIPDIKIMHLPSSRAYFIECKEQGDAGNAQERACKYATPSVLAAIRRRIGGVGYHPVGYLFSGKLVSKRKYIRELRLSFGFAANHLFLWDAERPVAALEAWVEGTIRPLLEGTAVL